MAISAVNISQDNIYNGSNLMPVHSPLVFLAQATYTGDYPTKLYVDLVIDGEVVDTFRAIPYRDVLASVREFAFVANDVIKPYMADYFDKLQLSDTLTYIDNITLSATLKFYDPEDENTSDSVEVSLIHGAAQFGENPNFDEVFNNSEDKIYYGCGGKFVYVYFYNDDPANVLTVDGSVTLDFAQDYDDAIFTDYDDTQFEIDV